MVDLPFKIGRVRFFDAARFDLFDPCKGLMCESICLSLDSLSRYTPNCHLAAQNQIKEANADCRSQHQNAVHNRVNYEQEDTNKHHSEHAGQRIEDIKYDT